MSPPLLSPSDLRAAPAGTVRLAGRVVAVEGDLLLLRDAFVCVSARLEPPIAAEVDDLLILTATIDQDGALSGARIESRRSPTSSTDSRGLESRRLVEGGVAARLELRASVLRGVRRFFEERGYLEVETPALVPSPGLDLHLDAFEIPQGPSGAPAYLSTSPEYQMKRLLVGGLPRIFQIARCFRRGELGSRHNPEFTMLEWYRAHIDMSAMMDETEELVRTLLLAHHAPRQGGLLGQPCDWDEPFARMRLTEAFQRFAQLDEAATLALAAADEERFYRLLIERVEPGLASLGRPVFLHHYPASQASLARLDPADARVCERFELYVGDLELCNGFGELTDPHEQRARLLRDQRDRRAQPKPVYPIDERFLAALEEGMPSAAGNALGLDRLVALCAGASGIDAVLAFPVDWLV